MTHPYNIAPLDGAANFADVEALADVCAAREGLDLPIGRDEAADRRSLLGYSENERLVGFAAIFDWGGGPEVSLVVHPDERRRGIGRALLAAARQTLAGRGATSFLLIAQREVAVGAAFAAVVGAALRFSEHRLVLAPARVNAQRPRRAELTMRPATADDLPVMVRVLAAAFGDPADERLARVAEGLKLPDRQYLIGELAGEPIGVLRIGRYGSHVADITSFGVLPEHQGRGYGRQLLGDAVDILLAEQWPEIAIEVETENANALGLYQSVGFVAQSTFDYYQL